MRTAAAAALLVLVTACGGGGTGARPPAAPSGTATPTATSLSPEADAIRAAVAKTLAACPCGVEVDASAEGHRGYHGTFTGVYDPATQTTALRDTDSGLRVLIVEGRTYLRVSGEWLELDFGGMPARPRSAVAALTLADPRIAFAFASNVTFMDPVTETKHRLGKRYEVEIDARAAAAATGPWAGIVGPMFSTPLIYDTVVLGKGGAFAAVAVDTDDVTAKGYAFDVRLAVTKTGVRAPSATVPKNARVVDVATLKA